MRGSYLLSLAAALLWPAPAAIGQDAPPAAPAPRKLALLVAISQYERPQLYPGNVSRQPPDWWNLNCRNDVDRIEGVLKERFRFAAEDVLVLTDAQATRDGITKAFREHLVKKVQPGDIVYFHYSGHGQQIPDDNGDELDGLDESLVTADYKSQDARENAATNLRDDTIGQLLGELKAKMTPRGEAKVKGNITVTFDCCFSGSATRGTDLPPGQGRLPSRGRGWKEEIDGPLPEPSPAARAQGRERGANPNASGLADGPAEGYVLLTATRSNQTAKEKRDERLNPMGAFTCYLVRALDKSTGRTTYQDVFERVNSDLTGDIPEQIPTIEGEADNLLFSGTSVRPDPYIVVQNYDSDEGVLTLPTGALHGEAVGSQFAIFPQEADVKDPAQKIADAEVIKVESTSCSAKLQVDRKDWPAPAKLKLAHAVETEHNYGDNVLLLLNEVAGPVANAIKGLKVVSTRDVTKDNYDVYVHADPNDPKVIILEGKAGNIRADGNGQNVRRFAADDAGTPKKIRDELFGAWKWRFLAGLSNESSDSLIKVDVRLVAVTAKRLDNGEYDGRTIKVRDDIEPIGNRLNVTEGDLVMIQLRNLSERRTAYLTVLDLTPTFELAPSFPDPGDQNDFPAAPGGGEEGWKTLPARYLIETEMSTNTDVEVDRYKALGTRDESNFTALLFKREGDEVKPKKAEEVKQGTERKRGGGDHGLARLVGLAALGEDPDPPADQGPAPPQLRGGQRARLRTSDWGTAEFFLEVRRKSKK
jgi:hypothetical protein